MPGLRLSRDLRLLGNRLSTWPNAYRDGVARWGDADGALVGDPVKRVVEEAVGSSARVEEGSVWVSVQPDGFVLPDEGWKFHVSSRSQAFVATLRAALPVLVREACAFKVASSSRVVSRLNDGVSHPASVGKSLTVYPVQDRVQELGWLLVEALKGHEGPRVLSDRRISSSAPVYYRYGPFVSGRRVLDLHGTAHTVLTGPTGEGFEGGATLRYRQPSWVSDPFGGRDSQYRAGGGDRLGGRFRVLVGVREAAHGNVYGAIDETNQTRVIVKQARPFVGEHAGFDARSRLRNERRILHRLAGLDGVPVVVDHFRQGDDEFLVTLDCAAPTLVEDVRRHGIYELGGPYRRSLPILARRMAHIVEAVHDRGVIMRDITPTNVLVRDGAVFIVDFGISAYDELYPPGGTPGYVPARQLRDDQPVEGDDVYALGMTLLYAATGLHPCLLGLDDDIPRLKALQTIAAQHGSQPRGIMSHVADLLSTDDARAHASFRELANGRESRPGSVSATLPTLPEVTPALVDEIVDVLRADLIVEVDRILAVPVAQVNVHDLNMHGGAAGIGLELLHHLGTPGVVERVGRLVSYTHSCSRGVLLLPGLFSGLTGVLLFLAHAAAKGIGPAPLHGETFPALGSHPEGNDLVTGAAGVILGHLHLYGLDRDPDHLATAQFLAQQITQTPPVRMLQPVGGAPLPAAVKAGVGAAHGLTGVAHALLALGSVTGDARWASVGGEYAHVLGEQVEELTAAAAQPTASNLAASWCQGLAGVGRGLLEAARILPDPSFVDLAAAAADGCLRLLPRVSVIGQCCGAAGVGEFLIDLTLSGRPDYQEGAYHVAQHMLLLSGGTVHHPVFVEPSPDSRSASWAMGTAGILGYFRRLSGGGTTSLPVLEIGAPACAANAEGSA